MDEIRDNQIRILKSIKDTELDVSIVLIKKDFLIGQLSGLNPGAVLSFDCPPSDTAYLSVNGKSFAKGGVVQVGENYGLKVSELIV